jgi:hypothetical protein
MFNNCSLLQVNILLAALRAPTHFGLVTVLAKQGIVSSLPPFRARRGFVAPLFR